VNAVYLASWYDFAVAIQEEGIRAKLLEKAIPIVPVASSQYPTPAKRPIYSVLDKSSFWQKLGMTPLHWRVQLGTMVKDFQEKESLNLLFVPGLFDLNAREYYNIISTDHQKAF